MGIIRKTASISTLGIVKFRSKKERLRRAESARQSAADDLAAEQAARTAAEDRVAAAEKRARQAELDAVHEAKRADKHGRRAEKQKHGRRAEKHDREHHHEAGTGRGRRARRKAAELAERAHDALDA
jgi:hypothetical protein